LLRGRVQGSSSMSRSRRTTRIVSPMCRSIFRIHHRLILRACADGNDFPRPRPLRYLIERMSTRSGLAPKIRARSTDISVLHLGLTHASTRLSFTHRGEFDQHRQIDRSDDFNIGPFIIEIAEIGGVPPNISVSTTTPPHYRLGDGGNDIWPLFNIVIRTMAMVPFAVDVEIGLRRSPAALNFIGSCGEVIV